MKRDNGGAGYVEIAIGAIAADGFFCLAFLLHLLKLPDGSIGLEHYLMMGVILSVLCTSCWVIYDDYWGDGSGSQGKPGRVVKTLRIKEMKEGAAIEYDGKSYRVNSIDRASGEIHIARIDRPGRIVVQIEGE